MSRRERVAPAVRPRSIRRELYPVRDDAADDLSLQQVHAKTADAFLVAEPARGIDAKANCGVNPAFTEQVAGGEHGVGRRMVCDLVVFLVDDQAAGAGGAQYDEARRL